MLGNIHLLYGSYWEHLLTSMPVTEQHEVSLDS